jgi:ABC-type uncharacterized transport system permease subunit
MEEKDFLTKEIANYNQIILALQKQTLTVVDTSNIKEYTLDSGQEKIRTIYKDDLTSIAKSIDSFKLLKQNASKELKNIDVEI